MTLIPITIDQDKADFRDSYLAARARLSAIQLEMSESPSPTKAYAAVEDLAQIVNKLLVFLKNHATFN